MINLVVMAQRQAAARRGAQVVDWFHRTEGRGFTKTKPAIDFQVEVPADADLSQILAIGYGKGLPRGSSRGGCVEVQTDGGVWSSPTGGRLNPKTAAFKTWDQLEAEENILDTVTG